jgi:hypothetical protein
MAKNQTSLFTTPKIKNIVIAQNPSLKTVAWNRAKYTKAQLSQYFRIRILIQRNKEDVNPWIRTGYTMHRFRHPKDWRRRTRIWIRINMESVKFYLIMEVGILRGGRVRSDRSRLCHQVTQQVTSRKNSKAHNPSSKM